MASRRGKVINFPQLELGAEVQVDNPGDPEILNVRSVASNSLPLICAMCGACGIHDQFFGRFCSSACVIRGVEVAKKVKSAAGERESKRVESPSVQDLSDLSCGDRKPKMMESVKTAVEPVKSDRVRCLFCGKLGRHLHFQGQFCGRSCRTRFARMPGKKMKLVTCKHCKKKTFSKGNFCSKTCISKFAYSFKLLKHGKNTKGNNKQLARLPETCNFGGSKSTRLHPKTVVGKRNGRSSRQGQGRGGGRSRSPLVNVTRTSITTCTSEEIHQEVEAKPSANDSTDALPAAPQVTPSIELPESENSSSAAPLSMHPGTMMQSTELYQLECAAVKRRLELYETQKELCRVEMAKAELEKQHLARKHALEIELLELKKKQLNQEKCPVPPANQIHYPLSWS